MIEQSGDVGVTKKAVMQKFLCKEALAGRILHDAKALGKIRLLRCPGAESVWLVESHWLVRHAKQVAAQVVRNKELEAQRYAARVASRPPVLDPEVRRDAGDQPLPPLWMRSIFDIGGNKL